MAHWAPKLLKLRSVNKRQTRIKMSYSVTSLNRRLTHRRVAWSRRQSRGWAAVWNVVHWLVHLRTFYGKSETRTVALTASRCRYPPYKEWKRRNCCKSHHYQTSLCTCCKWHIRKADVATAATMALCTHRPMLLTRCSSRIAVLKPKNERAGYRTVQIEKELMAVAPE